jgi:hypothetical protein
LDLYVIFIPLRNKNIIKAQKIVVEFFG